MAYNFSSPHITSLLFNPYSLSLALMHFDSSFSLYPSISLLSLSWLAIVLGGFMVVLWWFVGLICWLCSSRSWVWFRGFLLAMMDLKLVVVKFVGEDVLDGVAVNSATGYGWLCFDGSDRFVGFFFFCHESWLIWSWVVADLVDLVHGFFFAVSCGLWVFFVWLWLVVADWEVVEEESCWVVAVMVCGCGWWGNGGSDSVEARWPKQNTKTDRASVNHGSKRNLDLNWKTYGDLGMGLCWIFWVFFFFFVFVSQENF